MNYANIVSTIAGFVGILSLWLHWRRWVHDQRSKSLIVNVKTYRGGLQPSAPWYNIRISMRSRSNTGYKVERVQVRWPPSTKIAKWWECYEHDPVSGGGDKFVVPKDPKREVEPDLEVAHAGQANAIHQSGGFRTKIGDSHAAEFFVNRSRPGFVLIALTITAEDEDRPFVRWKKVWVK